MGVCLVYGDLSMKPTLVVTGSSGLVASDVLPRLKDDFTIIGIDRNPGTFTSVEADISKLGSVTPTSDRGFLCPAPRCGSF